MLITGGAGFIGCNLAHRLLRDGERVIVYDNLSREGVARNVVWLRQQHGDHVEVLRADVRDTAALRGAVERAGRVFHFAAQVAVTTSLVDPLEDFLINAHGTFNLLETIRQSSHRPPLVFTSTNKVYGGLSDVALTQRRGRYAPSNPRIAASGIDERRPLDFHSPYGCSKGAADQYVIDYARSFGLHAVVFRMSCIYGPHQFGTEDQGWVAHFLIRALEGEPIVLYGDGRQVRDVLFVEDLVNALLLAQANACEISGEAFNIGGGPANTLSLMELLDLVKTIHGRSADIAFREWRTGDQRYYVSNTSKFASATGWTPRVDVESGVRRLYAWLCEARARSRVETRPASDRHSIVTAAVAAPPGVAAEGSAA
ncbi:MAG TPA: SDR family NAD(P)-dependent oxidoreductase [Gemmatimonadaceae bacterium]|nr:SDR family NAD(P)-dependent oxidoreductase [Gemmatimonadaceae bacterium]